MSALTTTPLPFGLRDVKLKALNASEVAGSSVDLPNSRTFSFSETSDSEELRGDDGVVAVHDLGSGVEWELESGGVPLEAIVVMYGGTITNSGTTPNRVKTYDKTDIASRGYFEAEGQAISDSGGDFHVKLYKCKATGELSGEMSDGSFWLTGASGRAIGRTSDRKLYSFVQNETAAAIV
jgi:hypothetical protein